MVETQAKTDAETLPGSRLGRWDLSPWEFGLFVCLVLSGIFVASQVSIGLAVWHFGSPSAIERQSLLIFQSSGMQGGMLLGYLLFHRFYPRPNANRPVSLYLALRSGAVGFVLAYAALIIVAPFWQFALKKLGLPVKFQEPVLIVMEGGEPWQMGAMLGLIILVAPVAEELVFRAGVFRFLHGRLPLFASMGLSSLLFALMHWNWYSFVPIFALGLILCQVYRKTGSILASMTMHGLFNAVNVLLMHLFPQMNP